MAWLKSLSKQAKNNIYTYSMVIAAYLVAQTMIQTGRMSSALAGQLVPICAYVVMAVSLNLTVGVLGELSLGHAGFMSIGAFSGVVAAAFLQSRVVSGPARLVLTILIGTVLAGIFGFIVGVPALRLKGDYLAIVTLAFGEIIKNVINTLYVGYDAEGFQLSMADQSALKLSEEGVVVLRGPMGAVGITKLSTFNAGIVLVILTLVIVLNLINSRSGRAIMAIRDNRIAAESVGINVTRYKLTAFVISAALAGAAGAFYAQNYSTVVARKFDFNTSILVLVFVVLGGIGNIRGSIIAATVLTVLPELLRAFQDYRMLTYAVTLVLVMLATNNEQIKHLITRAVKVLPFGRLKRNKKEGSTHV